MEKFLNGLRPVNNSLVLSSLIGSSIHRLQTGAVIPMHIKSGMRADTETSDLYIIVRSHHFSIINTASCVYNIVRYNNVRLQLVYKIFI